MKEKFFSAKNRGHANHGWLDSHHSFSFASYFDPNKMNFGALRVLNDDVVAPNMGFGRHPHENMEIISIPLSGDLEHQDDMGNKSIIKSGEIQVMSAGTGVQHSEKNKNSNQAVNFLQIWIFPNKKDVKPRYDQQQINEEKVLNQFGQILSPDPEDDGVWIHQDAWFYLGKFSKTSTEEIKLHHVSNGVYVFVLKGEAQINQTSLKNKDATGIWDTQNFEIQVQPNSEILLMEVPMNY